MTLPRLGDMLVETGVITQEQLNQALAHQRAYGGRLGTCLVELGFIDEEKVARALSEQFHIPAATATQIIRIRPEVLAYLPAVDAERLRALPMREDAGKVWVALAEPTDAKALKELQALIKKPVRTMVAPERLIQYGLEKHYQARRKRNVVDVKHGTGEYKPFVSAAPTKSMSKTGEVPIYDPFKSSGALEAAYLDEQPDLGLADLPSAFDARLSLVDVVARFREAQKDEQILEAALSFIAQDVQRAAVFLLKQNRFEGWRGQKIDPGVLVGMKLPLEDLRRFSQALQAGQVHVGGLTPSDLLQLAAPFGVANESLGILVPIRLGQRLTGMILGTEASLDALRRKDEYVKMAQKLDYALHINHLKRLLAQP